MTVYPRVPLNPETIKVVSDVLGIPAEEACVLENYRRFTNIMTNPSTNALVYKEKRRIKFNDIEVKITIVRPIGREDEILPVILYLHGGGWVLGSYDIFSVSTDELVNRSNACLVYVDYSLSPEVKYPVALEECYATLCWIQKNADSIKVDSSRLAVAGDSAGGNLSTALALLSKQRGNTGISQQVLIYPVTDSIFETCSYEEHKDDPVINRNIMKYFWESYIRDENDYNLPLLAPLKSKMEDLKGLPPALVITAESDVLKDEGEAYAKKLKKAGVPTVSIRYNNSSHGFYSLGTPNISKEGILAIQQTASWLKEEWNIEL
ncbi:unnamed protein product [Rhizopus stolonifer]